MGVISAGLERGNNGGANQYQNKNNALVSAPWTQANYTDTLKEAGISRQRANEAEKLAEVPEEMFADIIASKKNKDDLSKKSVRAEIANRNKQKYRDEKQAAQNIEYNLSDDICTLINADIRDGLPEIAEAVTNTFQKHTIPHT